MFREMQGRRTGQEKQWLYASDGLGHAAKAYDAEDLDEDMQNVPVRAIHFGFVLKTHDGEARSLLFIFSAPIVKI